MWAVNWGRNFPSIYWVRVSPLEEAVIMILDGTYLVHKPFAKSWERVLRPRRLGQPPEVQYAPDSDLESQT